MDTSRTFLSKIRALFSVSKRATWPPLSPPVALLWVWLNMHQYPWICLSILENAGINCSKYARVLNMRDHLTCLKGCICKGYAEFRICPIMTPYASVIPEYASVCLNIPQYAWTWLDIGECPWICPKKIN